MPRVKSKIRAVPQAKTEPVYELVVRVVQRVSDLEKDVMDLKTSMTEFRTTLRQLDDRTLRGEALMGMMQGEQRKQTHLLSMLVRHLIAGIPVPASATDDDPTPPAGTTVPDREKP